LISSAVWLNKTDKNSGNNKLNISMKTTLREDCNYIVEKAVAGARPDAAVERILAGSSFRPGRLVTVAVGKAAWTMAAAAKKVLGARMSAGVVVTKYGHSQGEIEGLRIFEAGHPVPDENSFAATEYALSIVSRLAAGDKVLFLLSGGGSALFESPLVTPAELADITKQLLACGADIGEINTIRKRLSKVKGGRFALRCAPAKVFSIVLSDVVGDRLRHDRLRSSLS
jgi:glycerate 2-kinase